MLCANRSFAPSVRVDLHTITSYLSSFWDSTKFPHCGRIVHYMDMGAEGIFFRVDVSDVFSTSYVIDRKKSVRCSIIEEIVHQCVSRHAHSSAIKLDLLSKEYGSHFVCPL